MQCDQIGDETGVTFLRRPGRPVLAGDFVAPAERTRLPMPPLRHEPVWRDLRDVLTILGCGVIVGACLTWAWMVLEP
jgi:hypothetical protein